MEEEKIQSVSGTEVEPADTDYLAAIKELKKNSVDRAEYDRLRAENKKLLDTVINGQLPPEETEPTPKYRDTKVLKSIIANENSSNLDYWTAFLELRDKVIDECGYDPVVSGGIGPNGAVEPEYGEREGMAEQMEIIRECIKIANGDNQVFINETSKRAR